MNQLTLDKAETLARNSNYALDLTHENLNPVNWADASAFFLEGYMYAIKQTTKISTN